MELKGEKGNLMKIFDRRISDICLSLILLFLGMIFLRLTVLEIFSGNRPLPALVMAVFFGGGVSLLCFQRAFALIRRRCAEPKQRHKKRKATRYAETIREVEIIYVPVRDAPKRKDMDLFWAGLLLGLFWDYGN